MLKGNLSMVQKPKDYYQLKKVVGEDPVLEAEVVVVEATNATIEVANISVEPAAKRKKKKAKRFHHRCRD